MSDKAPWLRRRDGAPPPRADQQVGIYALANGVLMQVTKGSAPSPSRGRSQRRAGQSARVADAYGRGREHGQLRARLLRALLHPEVLTVDS